MKLNSGITLLVKGLRPLLLGLCGKKSPLEIEIFMLCWKFLTYHGQKLRFFKTPTHTVWKTIFFLRFWHQSNLLVSWAVTQNFSSVALLSTELWACKNRKIIEFFKLLRTNFWPIWKVFESEKKISFSNTVQRGCYLNISYCQKDSFVAFEKMRDWVPNWTDIYGLFSPSHWLLRLKVCQNVPPHWKWPQD